MRNLLRHAQLLDSELQAVVAVPPRGGREAVEVDAMQDAPKGQEEEKEEGEAAAAPAQEEEEGGGAVGMELD